MNWREGALCAQIDLELFFPRKGESPRAAKSICESCPVRVECLEWALDNDVWFGIWGGKSTQERRQLKREAAA